MQEIEAGETREEVAETFKAILPLVAQEIAEGLREPTVKEIEESWLTVSEMANKENMPRHRIYYAIRHHQKFAIKHKRLWRIKP